MPRVKDITATEKLLNLIREGKKVTQVEESPERADEKYPETKVKRFFRSRKEVASVNVGIDIGHQYLRMVKVRKEGHGRMAVVDCKVVPLPENVSKGSPEFRTFLRTELAKFCGNDRNVDFWAIMSAARVDVRHVRIPKVAKKQIETAVFWMIKKESAFDEKEMIFDFQIQGEVTEQGVNRLIALAYTAPRAEVEELKSLFNAIGMPLTGVSITPFAIQNMLIKGSIENAEGTVASLFIGNDFSRIDIYEKGKLTMTRGIKAGINSFIESIIERMESRMQGQSSLQVGHLMSREEARRILFSLSPDSPPLEEGDAWHTLTDEEKFDLIIPPLDRVITQVERTFEYYVTGLNYRKVDKIYVSSAMNMYPPMVKYIGDQLGIESDILDPLNLNVPCMDEKIVTTSVSDRIALTPAMGIALSDNEYTPNLLFRYRDKERVATIARMTRMIFSALVLITASCAGFFFYQMNVISEKRSYVTQLETELRRFHPPVGRDLILQMVSNSRQIQHVSKVYSERYTPLAVIGELAELTPPNIRLLSLKTNLGIPQSGGDSGKKETIQSGTKNVVVEGLVLGDRRDLEVSLVNYVMKLEASPLFKKVTVQKNVVEPFKKRDILHFILEMNIG